MVSTFKKKNHERNPDFRLRPSLGDFRGRSRSYHQPNRSRQQPITFVRSAIPGYSITAEVKPPGRRTRSNWQFLFPLFIICVALEREGKRCNIILLLVFQSGVGSMFFGAISILIIIWAVNCSSSPTTAMHIAYCNQGCHSDRRWETGAVIWSDYAWLVASTRHRAEPGRLSSLSEY